MENREKFPLSESNEKGSNMKNKIKLSELRTKMMKDLEKCKNRRKSEYLMDYINQFSTISRKWPEDISARWNKIVTKDIKYILGEPA